MARSIYSVTVTNPGSTTGSSVGFIDYNRIESYLPATGLTLLNSQNKRRANWRYLLIVQQLDLVGNCYIPATSIVATTPTATVEATTFSFSVIVEHGDTSLRTIDETVSSPVTYLDTNPPTSTAGTAIIKRLVARALVLPEFTVETDVYDPTATAPVFGTAGDYGRIGTTVASLAIGPVWTSLSAANAGSGIVVTETMTDST